MGFDLQLGYEVEARGIILFENGLTQCERINWVSNKKPQIPLPLVTQNRKKECYTTHTTSNIIHRIRLSSSLKTSYGILFFFTVYIYIRISNNNLCEQ